MHDRAAIELIATSIVDSAYRVHYALGPGLLESAYQACLTHELRSRRLGIRSEVILPISYFDHVVDAGYRIDMIVEECILVENKSVHVLAPVHEAQLLTYLKLSKCKLGFLINWNVHRIKEGIRRKVNNL